MPAPHGSPVAWAVWALVLALGGCAGRSGTDPALRNDLDAMQKGTIRINDQSFEVWLALTHDERERGLMQVTAEQLAPIAGPREEAGGKTERGMLFVFPEERTLGFWMYNTITALDIAYIDAAGRIVKTYTMAPLETRVYPSIEPAQFALEVRGGLLAELGVEPGQHVEIPESILKTQR
ncbi:MAG: DUF192 domain-containing protein [Planctomycetes bacterium]|nr:DUF192 domain-containing protein [Planctomycetota bacterium]